MKFRAWDKITKKVCDIVYIDFEDDEIGLINFEDRTRSFEDVELLQFAGLRQKREGDL